MSKKILLFSFVGLVAFTYSSVRPKFSWKTHGNVANFFENEKDFITFFEFRNGDTIAEVGVGNGKNMYGYSLVTDSTTFYLQDIDTTALSESTFSAVLKHCKKLKKSQTNTYYRCIGTEKSTRLPDSTFDKIILVASFHEFTFMDEMMTDIYKKLKSNGKLYILESKCLAHNNYTADETIEMMKKYKFHLVKKDGKDINKSSGLYRAVFKK